MKLKDIVDLEELGRHPIDMALYSIYASVKLKAKLPIGSSQEYERAPESADGFSHSS